MLYKTHRRQDITGYLLSIILLTITGTVRIKLFPLSENSFYSIVTIIMLYIGVRCGGHYPDFDHPPQNIKPQNFITVMVSNILQALGAKHRSVHTHSVLITTLTWVLGGIILKLGITDISMRLMQKGINISIISWGIEVLYFGIIMGIYSHLIADMMTADGIFFLTKKKVALVPKIKWRGNRFFRTGNTWENFYFKLLNIINIILLIITTYIIAKL